MDALTILYGKDGNEGVAQHIRDATGEIVKNYFGEMSNEQVLDILQEIVDADEFPDFVIDWYELLEKYLEER
jgi:hypothetical protein|tara:strand:+ start:91 stop:306 length:216 start_codon:yes stop_codon:yes gene_type:complete